MIIKKNLMKVIEAQFENEQSPLLVEIMLKELNSQVQCYPSGYDIIIKYPTESEASIVTVIKLLKGKIIIR